MMLLMTENAQTVTTPVPSPTRRSLSSVSASPMMTTAPEMTRYHLRQTYSQRTSAGHWRDLASSFSNHATAEG